MYVYIYVYIYIHCVQYIKKTQCVYIYIFTQMKCNLYKQYGFSVYQEMGLPVAP